MIQAQRAHRSPGRIEQRFLGRGRFARWRHVDSLLEERAGERIGLVENGQRLEYAVRDQPLDGELPPFDVALHLQGPLAEAAQIRVLLEQCANASERRHELSLVVGADHTAAGGKAQRLQHARVWRTAGQRAGILGERRSEISRNGQAGGLVELAREKLVLAGVRRRRRVKRDAQHRRHLRRQRRRPVAHRRHAVEPHVAEGFHRLRHPVVEFHGDGVVAPGIVEPAAAVRRQRRIHTQAPRGFGEDANLVTGGGCEQQQTLGH